MTAQVSIPPVRSVNDRVQVRSAKRQIPKFPIAELIKLLNFPPAPPLRHPTREKQPHRPSKPRYAVYHDMMGVVRAKPNII
jgi:hypothetical protein